MSILHLDFETRSTVDIRRSGAYVYMAHPQTDVLCLAYAFDDEPIEVWVPGAPLPERLVAHAAAGGAMYAHNAAFERLCWRDILAPRYGAPGVRLEQWYCTAAMAAAMALPRDLLRAAMVLGLDEIKDEEGHRLMMRLSRPRRTGPDGEPIWWDDPERFARLVEYCKQDVAVERALTERMRPLSRRERAVYLLDQRMNDRGFFVDVPMVEGLRDTALAAKEEADEELKEITGGAVTAVTRVAAIREWIAERGVDLEKLDKPTVRDALLRDDLPDDVRRVLEIRQEAGRSSVSKLDAFLRMAGEDDRARGTLLYHGASTGRWAGRGVQPQNMVRGDGVKDPLRYRKAAMAGPRGVRALRSVGLNPTEVVAALVRPCIQAAPGTEFFCGDFSQIEARVLGWYAGEPFRDKEYERMASAIYNIPLEEVKGGSVERHVGKGAVLGAGYQMGGPRFRDQVLAQTGIDIGDDLAAHAIRVYRQTKPGIPRFWYGLEEAAMNAVRRKGEIIAFGPLRLVTRNGFLWLRIPSGRFLAYAAPKVAERERVFQNADGTETRIRKMGLQYSGMHSQTNQWATVHGYGGLLTENVVQATARDVMVEALAVLEQKGFKPVLTVHDEILVEAGPDKKWEDFIGIMHRTPAWLEGCPIAAEGWRGERYQK